MNILVGYTGFVGSNLYNQYKFDKVFNSKNINDAFGTNPNLCVYAGIRAEKFRADKFPENDLAHINEAILIIEKINPKQLVLISTVDVIPPTQSGAVFEDTVYSTDSLTPYGKNRLHLESEIRSRYPNSLIVRLPALFGNGLKKNFIYDIINYIPSMLNKAKFEELFALNKNISNFYSVDENNFFRLIQNISNDKRILLKSIFKELGFSALNFTDSRSIFSFYNLKYLWNHIEILLSNNITMAHMANEPIRVAEIYQKVYKECFNNEIAVNPFNYTFFRTKNARILNTNVLNESIGYIFNKEIVVGEISEFVLDAIKHSYKNEL